MFWLYFCRIFRGTIFDLNVIGKHGHKTRNTKPNREQMSICILSVTLDVLMCCVFLKIAIPLDLTNTLAVINCLVRKHVKSQQELITKNGEYFLKIYIYWLAQLNMVETLQIQMFVFIKCSQKSSQSPDLILCRNPVPISPHNLLNRWPT